jgi:hypothetical protein
MVSRENKIIVLFVLVGFALHTATFYFTELPDEVRIGLLILVAVITPMIINNYLDNQAED